MSITTGRVEGWTQDDEDRTFGLNGHEAEWRGDEPPGPVAQRLFMELRAKLRSALSKTLKVPCTNPGIDPVVAQIVVQLNEAIEADSDRLPCGCKVVHGCTCYTRD